MGPTILTPAALKQFSADVTTFSNNIASQYNDGIFNPLDDLRLGIELYGYDVVWTSLKNRISNAVTNTTIDEVSMAVGNIISDTIPSNANNEAEQLFNDAFLYLIYKKVFNKAADPDDFFTITQGTAPSGPNAGTDATITSVDSFARFRLALSGMIAGNNGTKWLDDIASYVLPLCNFKAGDFKFKTATSTPPNPYNFLLMPENYTLTRPSTAFYQVAPNGFGDNNNAFTTVDDFLEYISANAVNLGESTENLNMTPDDLPPLNVAQAIYYITGIKGQASNYSTINNAELDKALPFMKEPSSLGILKDLENLVTNPGSGSTGIQKQIIYKSTNPIIKSLLRELTPNDLWGYLPTNELEGLPQHLTRPIGDGTTDVYAFSDKVKRVEIFAQISGLSVSDISDLYSGINGSEPNFTQVKTALSDNTANDTTALGYDKAVSIAVPGKDVVLPTVLAAWKFYRQTATVDFSKLTDADSIARYLSDDYTSEIIDANIFKRTVTGDPNTPAAGLNDSRNLWDKYLEAASNPDVKKRPSTDVDIIYAALKKLAAFKQTVRSSSNTPSSGVRIWLGISSIDRSDKPDNTTEDAFWGNARSYSADSDKNVARELAFYIANFDANPGTQKFNLLDNPNNLKYFKDIVKLGVDSSGKQNLYGLGVLYDPAATLYELSVTDEGSPSSNWGSPSQILNAVKSLGVISEELLLTINILSLNPLGISSYADLAKLASTYTLSKIVNLTSIPVDKQGNDLILAGNLLFSDSGNFVPGVTSSELLVTATMIDLAIGDIFEEDGTTPALDASDAVLNAKQVQQVSAVLINTSDSRYKAFLEVYVNLASSAGQNLTSQDWHTVVFRDLIRYRQFNLIGKYGKTSQWRAAISAALKIVFPDYYTLDVATEKNSDQPEPQILTLSKSNLLKKIAELINYQLYKKVVYVDSVTGVPETPDKLSDYVDSILSSDPNAVSSPYVEMLTRSIVLGLAVASKEGDSYSLNKAEFDELVKAGVKPDDILSMVVAKQSIRGSVVGNVVYHSLVKYDENGEPILE